jgi:hypothetical protein
VIKGAKTAIKKIAIMAMAPMKARVLDRSRRINFLNGLFPFLTVNLLKSDTRIQPSVEQFHEEVDKDKHSSEDEDGCLNHKVVPL